MLHLFDVCSCSPEDSFFHVVIFQIILLIGVCPTLTGMFEIKCFYLKHVLRITIGKLYVIVFVTSQLDFIDSTHNDFNLWHVR